MLRALWQYLTQEMRPRWRSILTDAELWVALLIAGGLAWRGSLVVSAGKAVDSVAGGLLTYASIAFGFSLAGLTIALTLPDREFAAELARSRNGGRGSDAYSDLLFVFSWAACCHWALLVVLLVVSAVTGPAATVLPPDPSAAHRAAVFVVAALTIYGVSQFLVTVITISQVGRLYIQRLAAKKD